MGGWIRGQNAVWAKALRNWCFGVNVIFLDVSGGIFLFSTYLPTYPFLLLFPLLLL